MDSIPKQNEEAFVTKSKDNASLLQGITDQLKELETSFKDMKISCVDKICQNTSSSSSSSEEEDDDDNKIVSTVQKILNVSDKEFPTINKLNRWTTRNYYSRPTPPDIPYEEKGHFRASHFDGTTLYEWNIDGKAEHEIILIYMR